MVSRQQLLSMRMGSKVLSQVWVWGASPGNGRANKTTSLFYIFLIWVSFVVALCRHSVALWCSITPCMWSSGIFFISPTRLDRAKKNKKTKWSVKWSVNTREGSEGLMIRTTRFHVDVETRAVSSHTCAFEPGSQGDSSSWDASSNGVQAERGASENGGPVLCVRPRRAVRARLHTPRREEDEVGLCDFGELPRGVDGLQGGNPAHQKQHWQCDSAH